MREDSAKYMEEIWDKTKRSLANLAHFQKRNRIKRYGFPIILAFIVFLAKLYSHPILGDHSAFLLASFVVAASSWYGGLGPGIIATILAASAVYSLDLSRDLNVHPYFGDLIVIFIFIIEGFLISITSEARYEMEKQKDEFISFVSHELKNPLTSIKGFAELVGRSFNRKNDTKLKTYINQIDLQANRILELINDLLDITKIEVGKFIYKEDIFNLDDLVKEVIFHQKLISPGRYIKLVGHTNKSIQADQYRIRQVIVNLLTNALKYSPDTTEVVVRLKTKRKYILISVRDRGIGIRMKEKSHIFDRYYRTENVQRSRFEGLGLGLYITNQIVTHHQGRIWVESNLGKGSTFYVSLPISISKKL